MFFRFLLFESSRSLPSLVELLGGSHLLKFNAFFVFWTSAWCVTGCLRRDEALLFFPIVASCVPSSCAFGVTAMAWSLLAIRAWWECYEEHWFSLGL